MTMYFFFFVSCCPGLGDGTYLEKAWPVLLRLTVSSTPTYPSAHTLGCLVFPVRRFCGYLNIFCFLEQMKPQDVRVTKNAFFPFNLDKVIKMYPSLDAWHTRWKSGTNIMGITNHYLTVFKAQSMGWNPYLTWSGGQELRLDRPWTYGKAIYSYFGKGTEQ